MDVIEFCHRLEGLDEGDIAAIAAGLRDDLDSADAEVAWWRATIAITSELRRLHRTREASVAAHRVTAAVLASPGASTADRDDVTAVARAAAEVARVLVAGDGLEVPASVRDPLLHPWQLAG